MAPQESGTNGNRRSTNLRENELAAVFADSTGEWIWYLAYGSNMNPDVLCKRRGVYPAESVPCRIPGYKLNFTFYGIPYTEPSFASIHAIDSTHPGDESFPELQGVVHRITAANYRKIRQTEGGGGYDNMGYADEIVQVTTYDGRVLTAVTLVVTDDAARHDSLPSRRYRNLLATGARHYGLDLSYVEFLERLPCYMCQTRLQRLGKWTFVVASSSVWFPFLCFVMICRRLQRRPPRAFYALFYRGQRLFWFLHDRLWAPVFGSGCSSSSASLACK